MRTTTHPPTRHRFHYDVMIPSEIIFDSNITPHEKVMYAVLAACAAETNPLKTNRSCSLTQEELAQRCRWNVRFVRRLLVRLQAKNRVLLHKIGRLNRYELL